MLELVDMPGMSILGSISRLWTCRLKKVGGVLGAHFVTQSLGYSDFCLATFLSNKIHLVLSRPAHVVFVPFIHTCVSDVCHVCHLHCLYGHTFWKCASTKMRDDQFQTISLPPFWYFYRFLLRIYVPSASQRCCTAPETWGQ